MEQEVLVDARWLEPPEPMERVLRALPRLLPGQYIRLLLHREPHPLYGILAEMGYQHRTRLMPDGCYDIRIEPRTGVKDRH